MNEDNEIIELVSVCNIIELTNSVLAKVGLEYLAPLENVTKDELISAAILKCTRGEKL